MIRPKKKISNINKDHTRRKKFLNKEIKKMVLKSIIQNLNIKHNIRALALKKLSRIQLNHSISRQKNNLCLKSGRFKGVLKINNIGRHEIKRQSLFGFLQNIKIKSW